MQLSRVTPYFLDILLSSFTSLIEKFVEKIKHRIIYKGNVIVYGRISSANPSWLCMWMHFG